MVFRWYPLHLVRTIELERLSDWGIGYPCGFPNCGLESVFVKLCFFLIHFPTWSPPPQVFMLLYNGWDVYPCYESLRTQTFSSLISLQKRLRNMISLTSLITHGMLSKFYVFVMARLLLGSRRVLVRICSIRSSTDLHEWGLTCWMFYISLQWILSNMFKEKKRKERKSSNLRDQGFMPLK